MNIWSKKKKGHRLYYGKYLCRAWNRDAATEEKKLEKFEIFFMKEYSNPPGQEPTLSRHSIWQHDCFKKSDVAKPAAQSVGSSSEQAVAPTAEKSEASRPSSELRESASGNAAAPTVQYDTTTLQPNKPADDRKPSTSEDTPGDL